MERVYEIRVSHNTLLINRFVERHRDDYVTKAKRYPSAIQLISYSCKTANYDNGRGYKVSIVFKAKVNPRLGVFGV